MASLGNQLSSLRDDRNKNLKKFISHYKSNIQWHKIEVCKSWNYILSIDDQFEECKSLFSEICYGSSSIILERIDRESMDSSDHNFIFKELRDIEFLTSKELEDLNNKIRTFIELCVPYFMNRESQYLIDYLIYKYNIAVSFSEYLMILYTQYNDSEYYCKLLSLITISNESSCYSLYNEIKSVTLNFTEHKYVTSKLVFSAIGKNFSLYKQISTCYNNLATKCKINTKIVSFLNTINVHYVIVNCKVMDNNEIRYMVNIIKEGLTITENLEYLSSHLCLLLTLFTHIQFTIIVQRELVRSLNSILNSLFRLQRLKVDHLILLKYIVMLIYLMLQYQNQTLDKMPQDITNSLIDILQKHESTIMVFNNLNMGKIMEFSRFSNVVLNSLVASHMGKLEVPDNYTMDKKDYFGMEKFVFFINFVNKVFGYKCMKMMVFYLIDELIRISMHVKQYNESIIVFDESGMGVNMNTNLKFSSQLMLLNLLFKLVKDVNPSVLEHGIMEYMSNLSYELVNDHLEVVMFIYKSLSEDITYRMLILINKYSESKGELGSGRSQINTTLNIYTLLNDNKVDILKNENVYNSMVEFIITMYSKTDSHTSDLNQLLYNFVNKSLNDDKMSKRLESDDKFWKSIPISVSIEVLIRHIQQIIDNIDSKFKYTKEDMNRIESLDNRLFCKKGHIFIFTPYIKHIKSLTNEVDVIQNINRLIMKIDRESVKFYKSNINMSLKQFIRFLSILTGNKEEVNEYMDGVDNNNDTSTSEINKKDLIDGKTLINLNNDIISMLSNSISGINRSMYVDMEGKGETGSLDTGYIVYNSSIYNPFSILYYQYETMKLITKTNEDMELVHSQYVIINDMFMKCVNNHVYPQDVSRFVIDFYKFMISKFEIILMRKRSEFNRIMVIKRFEIILNSKELFTHFINFMKSMYNHTKSSDVTKESTRNKAKSKKARKNDKEIKKIGISNDDKVDRINYVEVQDDLDSDDTIDYYYPSKVNGELEGNYDDYGHKYMDYVSDTVELMMIIKIKDWNGKFRINYNNNDDDGNITMNVNVPFKYKYRFLNLDYLRLTRDTYVSHLLTNSSNNSIVGGGNVNNIDLDNIAGNGSIILFDSINEVFFDSSLELILTVFRLNADDEWSVRMYTDLLLHLLGFVCDSSFKYINKFISLIIGLSKACSKTVITMSEITIPFVYSEVQLGNNLNTIHSNVNKDNANYNMSYKVALKYDMKNFITRLVSSANHSTNVNVNMDIISSLFLEFMKEDSGFFNIIMVNIMAHSNSIYNLNYVENIFGLISGSNCDMKVLYILLEQMGDILYNILCNDMKDSLNGVSMFVDIFSRYSMILYGISRTGSIYNDDKNTEKYIKHLSELLIICSRFRSVTNKISSAISDVIDDIPNVNRQSYEKIHGFGGYDNKDYYKILRYSGVIFEQYAFISLYNINNGIMWRLPIIIRNYLYYSFMTFYKNSNKMYTFSLVQSLFVFNGVDDKVVLGLVYYAFNKGFSEELVTYIINNIESLKTYEVLVYMIEKSVIKISEKMTLIGKILNNVVVSTDIQNKKLQTFIFTNLNRLMDVYVNLLSNNRYENGIYDKITDTKLEKELKTIISNNVDEIEFKYEWEDPRDMEIDASVNEGLGIGIFKGKSELTSAKGESGYDNGGLDEQELLSLLGVIVNSINFVFNSIQRLNVQKANNFNKTYNELFHNTCTLISRSMSRFGISSFKLMKTLINNVIVCTTKVSVETNKKHLDECIRSTVIATAHNLLSGNMRENGELIYLLIDRNNTSAMEESIYSIWASYLMYLYFSINKGKDANNVNIELEKKYERHSKITEYLNSCGNTFRILTNVIWIYQIVTNDPVNKYGINISRFIGYEQTNLIFTLNKKDHGLEDEEVSNEIYGYVLYHLQKSDKCNLNIDVSLFSDKNSEKYGTYKEINELLYSLLSSYVLYKYNNNSKKNKHLKSNDMEAIDKSNEDTSILNTIASSIIHIFRLNHVGGFNIHVYGTLNSIFDNKLNEMIKSIDSSENIWNKVDVKGNNYEYYLHLITTLVNVNNRFNASMKIQDNRMKFNYEKELEKLHNVTSRVLFDFYDYSNQIYILNEKEYLFNQISYMRSEVWEYFVNSPPSTCDTFIHILEKSFGLLLEHCKNNGKLLWSYLDMLCSMKVLIKMVNIGENGITVKDMDRNVHKIKYKCETNKMLKTIEKFKEVSEELLFYGKKRPVDVIQGLFMLFLVLAQKHYTSLLNRDFCEFSIKLILHNQMYSKHESTNNQAKLMFDPGDEELLNSCLEEVYNMKVGEFIKSVTESPVSNYQYFNRELLMSHVTYYTSMHIDIKSIIRLVSLVSGSTVDGVAGSIDINPLNIIYQLSRLLISLSYNIHTKRPKSKYIDDLNDVYFININFYSMYSFKILFGGSEVCCFTEYNRSHASIDEMVVNSKKMSTSLFTNNSSTESVTVFERSFVSYILKYFSLISSNKLLDILEKHAKMSTSSEELLLENRVESVIESDLKSRLLFITILSSLYEYGSLGATNLIMTRLYQHIEDIAEYSVSEARINLKSVDTELSFSNTWTWFNNSRLILQLIQKSIDTWNVQRGVVPDVIVNSWVKIIRNFITVFDFIPINAYLELDNITTAWSNSLEDTLRSLINGFITQDDKIVKIESCLSDNLPTKSLNVKIGSLVIMNKLWDDLGMHLSVSIKNVMPIIGELVDDENEIVRRISAKLDEKVKEVLYQN